MRAFPALTVVFLLAFGQSGAADTGDVERGKALFSQCKGCHQIGEGARTRIGPHLNGLFGRAAASLEEFRYSAGFTRAGINGLEWHRETLDAFLENPRALVSGTRMSYRGLKEAGDRADLIAFLRQFSANPSDFPEADPTANPTDPDVDPEILALKGDPDYGEYLSGECTTCHQASGSDQGIPSITLWPEEDFVAAMHAYKSKARPHPVMQLVAGRLGNEEIAALAAYFARLQP